MNTPKELSESLLAACKAAGIHNPRYIAQNANGKVIHHDNQPSRKGWDSIWGGGGIPKRLNHPPYASDWKESLLEWVDHVADTSKMIDDACEIAYHAHLENGDGFRWSRLDCYRAAWQDALAWKGGGDQASGIEAMVCDDIAKRQQVGIAKYGTTVAGNPLTHAQWLQHAYEECLDMAVYLKRAMAEEGGASE
jgi:hypothetical protein